MAGKRIGWLGSPAGSKSRRWSLHHDLDQADPDLWGFGDGQKAFFWLKQGKPDPASIHWGFIAENNKAVDAFYKAAIAAGAKDNISPRARLEYYPGYYAADVFDPDGYTFEVVHKS